MRHAVPLVFAYGVLVVSGPALAPAAPVQYKVTFNSTWSQPTHPVDWPTSAHFSGLIGGTHDAGVTFWELGGLASLGIKNMAERGYQSTLGSEVTAAIGTGHAYSVITGASSGIRPSPGSTSTTFQIDAAHPLVTLVSMIAPSPDWFVGVAGLNMFEAGHWRTNVLVDLLPYDAGTDSGVTFTSADLVTNPPAPISHLAGPFAGTPPLGTFLFELIPALGDVNSDGIVDLLDVQVIGQHWQETGTGVPGDANGDGIVNLTDVQVVGINWTQPAAPAAGSSVPEPSTWALGLLGGGWLAAVAVRGRLRFKSYPARTRT